jgi:hypothetical protein
MVSIPAILSTSNDAMAGAPATGCCLREFSTQSDLVPSVLCTNTTLTECFQFAGVGVVTEGFEPGKVCATDGRSCVAPGPNRITLDLGLGRPPEDPNLPGSILIYPSFDKGQPATIRARVINNTSSNLTHVTVRIFQGDEELLNDENVLFNSVPGGGFVLDEETTLPAQSEIVGVLVCYATGEMGYSDCPEYPTGITGGGAQAAPQVFTALAFGVLLQAGEVHGAPLTDAVGLVALFVILLGFGVRRQRHRAASAIGRS